jgi:antitoxin component YwqK of YwqJK toxin-antitoxin module
MKVNQVDKNGLKTGIWEFRYLTGQVMLRRNYKSEQPHGLSEDFSAGGRLMRKVNFKNGKENGRLESYNYDGSLFYCGMMKDGVRVGLWEFYYNKNQGMTSRVFYVS